MDFEPAAVPESEYHPKLANDTESHDDPAADVEPTSAEILVEHKPTSSDPLLEANAYFAYGYYQKANDLLSEIVDRDPDVAEYRLRLLRVLHAAEEREGFLNHASVFKGLVGDREDSRWLEAARMGRDMFPHADLFQSAFSSDELHLKFDPNSSGYLKPRWSAPKPPMEKPSMARVRRFPCVR